MGSGTTIFVANRMKRNSIGIEIMPEYFEMVRRKVQPVEMYLLDPPEEYAKTKPARRYAVR
jgi:site-specific DNA-methyltransferase (adenine-specific)